VFSNKEVNAVFCGNINAELDKQSIVTAGRVISARYQLTKKGESFAICILEDVSGQVEVIVWPRTYAKKEELWKEGNELVVWGKVRVRDEEITIACDDADYYEPPAEGVEQIDKPASIPAAKPAVSHVQDSHENKTATVPAVGTNARRRLTIGLHQTKDEQGDVALLQKIVGILREYPGKDEVRLNVINGGAPIPLKMPNIPTGYSPEMKKRLVELVGEESLKVEKI
jgi:DNA polymerase-3 subunit alpha